jgi:hypothetical protein
MHRDFADGLDCVGVHDSTALVTQPRDILHRLNHPGLIVREHDACQTRVAVRDHQTICIRSRRSHIDAAASQFARSSYDTGMLDR